jgi:hypothetical protein
MYIYHVSWAHDGAWGLNAVVQAETLEQAIGMLDFSDEDKCIKGTMIGVSNGFYAQALILARESL